MSEHLVGQFLLQMFVVLTAARLLGELFRRIGQPPVVGEILAGVILGKTVLGYISPDLFDSLFPTDELGEAMFGTVSQLGIFLLLLIVGLEVDVASAWKMRAQSLAVAVTGVVVPLAMGMGACWFLFDVFYEPEGTSHQLIFALFVGAAVAITAITVVAKILFDMRIVKSDLGLLLLSAMAINDLLGWVILAVVMGMVASLEGSAGGDLDLSQIGMVVGGIIVFTGVCATIGRRWATRTMLWFDKKELPTPATPLSFVVCLGLGCGLVTKFIGIHPIFGFFIAGLMAGDHRGLSEHTRSVITQMVEAIFVPLFFAGISLRVDFAAEFNLTMVATITILSIGGKFFGAWLGTLFTKIPKFDRVTIGIAHTPGGPMGVLLALVAKESEIIGPQMFVAIVFASIFSSLLVGPGMTWSLRRPRGFDIMRFVSSEHIVPSLEAVTPRGAIAELVDRAAAVHKSLNRSEVMHLVYNREDTMSTGIGDSIAVPHARIEGLEKPVVMIGISREGLDWNAIDDQPAHLVFLILTPVDANDDQLAILSVLAKALHTVQSRNELLSRGADRDQLLSSFKKLCSAVPQKPSVIPE